MTKLAAGIVEYADAHGLYRCLSSLGFGDHGIDTAIVVHARFQHFNLEYSPLKIWDETLETIYKFPDEHVELITPRSIPDPVTEIDARNLYLQTAAELGCDWLLVIDTDEFIARNADWQRFREQLEFIMSLNLPHQIFDIQFEGISAIDRGPRPRLFYRPGTIKYWKRHFWWVLEEQMICLKGVGDAGRLIEGIYLMHDGTVRKWDQAYNTASYHYKDWQQQYEGLE